MQILLVDDSPVMRMFITRTLRMTGIDLAIDEAENGAVAMEKAFSLRPDVIITDLNMPGMSGEELVMRVSAARELSGTQVLVLSADRSLAREEDMRRAGAAAYLTKPVTPERLKQSLIAVMEGRK
jgi:two-component system chemotaxis response regulator CheY